MCQKPFYQPPSRKAAFCSYPCAMAKRKGIKRDKAIGKKISKSKKGISYPNQVKRFERPCAQCKIPFSVIPSQTRNFCSLKCFGISRRGTPAWNKGISFRAGIPKPWIRSALKGEKNPNWKGGITPVNKAIRSSFEYKEWRKSVFSRDDWTCQECGLRGDKVYLHADHIKPFAYFPELRLDLSNGRTLCVDCHKKTDSYLSKALINYKTKIQ